MYKLYFFLIPFTLVIGNHQLKAQTIELLQGDKPTSLRGLSVVDDKTAWVSGSKGYIAITSNGGKTWDWQQVKGYEQADFRDIEAFSDKEAIIMSSGTPALVLKTIDGGAIWKLSYKNDDKVYFLDAMDFYDKKHGYILGDPINNKFLILETTNGGNSWHPFKHQPKALLNEAAFAASGTCLRVDSKGDLTIVTGGSAARCITIYPTDTAWTTDILPIVHGKNSQGAFSIANGLVIVGGDYSNDNMNEDVACRLNISGDMTRQYLKSYMFPGGYQSCVEGIYDDNYISTGTSGSNLSTDSGRTWHKFDNVSYNVCRKAKSGNLILLAGDKGKIGLFHL